MDPRFTPARPAHGYARRPPDLFNLVAPHDAQARAFAEVVSRRRVDCPEEGAWHFDRGYVYEGCYVLDPALDWWPPSVVDLAARDAFLPVMREVIGNGHHHRLDKVDMPTVTFAKAGEGNYGHVVAEMLPKLVNIPALGLRRIRLLIPERMRAFGPLVQRVLAALQVEASLEWVPVARLQEITDLVVLSPVSRHGDRKSHAFLALRDLVLQLDGIVHAPARRLFVARNGSRTATNQDDVAAVFAERGFEPVYPERLEVAEQVRLFATASHVAGTLGAGMANLAWAPPDCHAVMIDPGIGDDYFWDFASLLGQRFSWVFAGPLCGYSAERAAAGFSVDCDGLRASLRLLGI